MSHQDAAILLTVVGILLVLAAVTLVVLLDVHAAGPAVRLV